MVKRLVILAFSVGAMMLAIEETPARVAPFCVLENHPCKANTPCCSGLTCWDASGVGENGVCTSLAEN